MTIDTRNVNPDRIMEAFNPKPDRPNFQQMNREKLIAHIENEAEAFRPPGVTPLEAAADVVGQYQGRDVGKVFEARLGALLALERAEKHRWVLGCVLVASLLVHVFR